MGDPVKVVSLLFLEKLNIYIISTRALDTGRSREGTIFFRLVCLLGKTNGETQEFVLQ